jgi:hypothetical protein
MSRLKSLLITVVAPAEIFISEKPLGKVSGWKNKTFSIPGFPLWATSADLLVNSKREFLGLCYYVPDDSKDFVRMIAARMDPDVVRYVTSTNDNDASPYLKNNLIPSHFQIKWSRSPSDDIEVAQLGSDYWYFSDSPNDQDQLLAVSVNDIDEILDAYNLSFPGTSHLIQFEPDLIAQS